MGIDRIGPQGPSRATGPNPSGRAAARRDATDAIEAAAPLRPPQDRIDLSAAARSLTEATPEERAELVRTLRHQVQAGAYHVDPDAVADSMVTKGDL
ncbi:MAG: flagellar biosynthesis anti-sigma factor FlgM [Dehalococcoidia bacterium]